jgi:choline dehydrogenase-like flavoprotein
MEHLSVPGAVFLSSKPNHSMRLYGDPLQNRRPADQAPGRGFLVLQPNTMQTEQLLNGRAFLEDMTELEAIRATSAGIQAGDALYEDFTQTGNLLDAFTKHIGDIAGDLDNVAIYGYRKFFEPTKDTSVFLLYNHLEHAPNRNSRVTLGDELDTLGMPSPQLDWQFSEIDQYTHKRTNEVMARELSSAGLGRVKLLANYPDPDWPSIRGGLRGAWHQMGTTRMGTNQRTAVVDKDCMVFGVDNLFVAGSSVFPTSGYTNPTLTIVAMAIRLAEHLKTLEA